MHIIMSKKENFNMHRFKVKLKKLGEMTCISQSKLSYVYSDDKAEIASEHYMDKANGSLSSAGKP